MLRTASKMASTSAADITGCLPATSPVDGLMATISSTVMAINLLSVCMPRLR